MTIRDSRSERPTAVIVIGWVWISLATFMLLTGLTALTINTTVVAPAFYKAGSQIGRGAPPVIAFIFRYFGLFAAGQISLAAFIIYSGIMFLGLRPWARTSLEVATWLGEACVVALGVLVAFPTPGSAVAGVMIILIFGLPLYLLVRRLRGEAVTEAFHRRGR